MSRQPRSRRAAPPIDSHVLKFVSRAEELQLRGQRNYNRYMLVIKKLVAADSPERVQWQREAAEESQRDVAWNRRHGPLPGGVSVLHWRHDSQATREERHRTAHAQQGGQWLRFDADGR